MTVPEQLDLDDHSRAVVVNNTVPATLQTALLLVRTVGCSKEFWPLAVALRDSHRYRCIIVLGREVLQWKVLVPRIVQRYQDGGFRVLDGNGRLLTHQDHGDRQFAGRKRSVSLVGRGIAILKALRSHVRTSYVFQIIGLASVTEFISRFIGLQHDRRVARRLLAHERACVVVIQECEHSLGLDAIVVKVAEEQGIPTVMIPGADHGLSPLGRLENYLLNGMADCVDLQRFSNRLTGALFSRWVQSYAGRRMLRYPAAEALAGWCSGVISRDPWVCLPFVRKRAVLCQRALADIHQRQPIFTPTQLVVTGQPILDSIYETWRRAPQSRQDICAALELDPRKRLIVFTVPQLVPHRLITATEQRLFAELVVRIASEIPSTQIVVSLYWGADRSTYQWMCEQYGAVIAEHIDVRQLVAVCDVFVCVRSSVVWTAIACQKPTLAIDFWNIGPVPFYNCPGLQVITRREDFPGALSRLLADDTWYDHVVEQLRQAAPMWASHFDGQATARTLAVIDELVSQAVSIEGYA